MTDDLTQRAEALKGWIQDRAGSGGCRVLSQGKACGCPLCTVDALLAALVQAEQEKAVAVQNARFEGICAEGERIAERVFRECELDANISDGNESADPCDHIVPCVNARIEAAESTVQALRAGIEGLKADGHGLPCRVCGTLEPR